MDFDLPQKFLELISSNTAVYLYGLTICISISKFGKQVLTEDIISNFGYWLKSSFFGKLSIAKAPVRLLGGSYFIFSGRVIVVPSLMLCSLFSIVSVAIATGILTTQSCIIYTEGLLQHHSDVLAAAAARSELSLTETLQNFSPRAAILEGLVDQSIRSGQIWFLLVNIITDFALVTAIMNYNSKGKHFYRMGLFVFVYLALSYIFVIAALPLLSPGTSSLIGIIGGALLGPIMIAYLGITLPFRITYSDILSNWSHYDTIFNLDSIFLMELSAAILIYSSAMTLLVSLNSDGEGALKKIAVRFSEIIGKFHFCAERNRYTQSPFVYLSAVLCIIWTTAIFPIYFITATTCGDFSSL